VAKPGAVIVEHIGRRWSGRLRRGNTG
jgi:hypothetical protein